jgi:hypothetical protein
MKKFIFLLIAAIVSLSTLGAQTSKPTTKAIYHFCECFICFLCRTALVL